MGEMPMPEGTTFDEMRAMYDVITKMENKEYAAEQLKWYEGLWREWKPKYDELDKVKHEDDDLMKRFEDVSATMKMIKDGIKMYRGWLSE